MTRQTFESPALPPELDPLEVVSFVTVYGDGAALPHMDDPISRITGECCFGPRTAIPGNCGSDFDESCNWCPPSEVIGTKCLELCKK